MRKTRKTNVFYARLEVRSGDRRRRTNAPKSRVPATRRANDPGSGVSNDKLSSANVVVGSSNVISACVNGAEVVPTDEKDPIEKKPPEPWPPTAVKAS